MRHFQNPYMKAAFLKCPKSFIPQTKALCESETRMGFIWLYFHSIVFEKLFWHFQNPNLPSVFLISCFIPRKTLRKQSPYGVHMTVFPFYCVSEAVLTILKSEHEINLFDIVLSPKGTSESRTQMGSIWQSFNFIVFENLFYDFQNPKLKSVFLKSWTCFIPRRDSARDNKLGSRGKVKNMG